MFSLLLAGALLTAPPAAGAGPDDDVARQEAEFDARLAEQEKTLPADVARTWHEANAAREAGRQDEAVQLYGEVAAKAPGWSHAPRRACSVLSAQGRRDEALALCRKALELERSTENLNAFAAALLNAEKRPGKPVLKEALQYVEEALSKAPDSYNALRLQCSISLDLEYAADVERCSARMLRLGRERPEGHYFASFASAMRGDFRDARARIARAHERGLPDEAYRELDAIYARNEPLWSRYGFTVLAVLGGWLGVFGALVVAGFVLSHIALRQAAALPVTADAPSPGAGMRRAYAAVLWASCVFYIVSVPLVALTVLGTVGAMFYGFLMVGRIPLKLAAIVLVLAVVTVWSLLSSFFRRRKWVDPGIRLDPQDEPRLKVVLDEVAARVGTRPVDTVFLTPGTDLAVFERSRLFNAITGKTSERCLILGAGVIPGFQLGAFRAVLAHEYGHFSNRDTAGGGFALVVRRAIVDAAQGIAQGGAASWINPAWLFLNGFYRVFLRISHGASRLQEVLADRFAAFAYGADAFEKGLRHAVECSVAFDAHVQATIADAQRGAIVANFYRYTPATKIDENVIAKAKAEVWNAPASPYDSHPPPTERIALVRRLVASPSRSSDDANEVWSLFKDPAAVESRLSEDVRSNLAAQGLVMRKDAAA